MLKIIFVFLIGLLFTTSTSFAEEKPITITINASDEFEFVEQTSAAFTINDLNPAHQSIESLQDVDAIGVVYLGNIMLTSNATPLSVLREVSAQLSQGLHKDFALIADSVTSQSLSPHELLMLYHPSMVITLGLVKVADSETYSLIGTYAKPSQPDVEQTTQ